MRNLHEKFVRGDFLNEAEKVTLENWYAEQDRIEGEELKDVFAKKDFDSKNEAFQAVLREVSLSKKRVAEIARQNEEIKRENENLREKLLDRKNLKVA